jgi:hypothetical protein
MNSQWGIMMNVEFRMSNNELLWTMVDRFMYMVKWRDEGKGSEREVLEELPLSEMREMFLEKVGNDK